jgi:hypothetical protein
VLVEDRLQGCSGPCWSDRNASLMSSANNTNIGGRGRRTTAAQSQSQLSNERCDETEGLLVYTLGAEPSLFAQCERRFTHPSIKGQTPSGCCRLRLWCGCPPAWCVRTRSEGWRLASDCGVGTQWYFLCNRGMRNLSRTTVIEG